MLIQGDNLDALKALLPFFAGRVKCVYIDPPYNTRSAFEHYDDNLEHTQWLTMMWPRLELLRELLTEDGSIWVSIDDNEAHYLKVIMDEVFGRSNFVGNVVWQKLYTVKNSAKSIFPICTITCSCILDQRTIGNGISSPERKVQEKTIPIPIVIPEGIGQLTPYRPETITVWELTKYPLRPVEFTVLQLAHTGAFRRIRLIN